MASKGLPINIVHDYVGLADVTFNLVGYIMYPNDVFVLADCDELLRLSHGLVPIADLL